MGLVLPNALPNPDDVAMLGRLDQQMSQLEGMQQPAPPQQMPQMQGM